MTDFDSPEGRKLDREAARYAMRESIAELLKRPRDDEQVAIATEVAEQCARELAASTGFDVDGEHYGLTRAFCSLLCNPSKRTEWAMRSRTKLAEQVSGR